MSQKLKTISSTAGTTRPSSSLTD